MSRCRGRAHALLPLLCAPGAPELFGRGSGRRRLCQAWPVRLEDSISLLLLRLSTSRGPATCPEGRFPSDPNVHSAEPLGKHLFYWVTPTGSESKNHEPHRNPRLGSKTQLGRPREHRGDRHVYTGCTEAAAQHGSSSLLPAHSLPRPFPVCRPSLALGTSDLCVHVWKRARLCVHGSCLGTRADVGPVTYTRLGGGRWQKTGKGLEEN